MRRFSFLLGVLAIAPGALLTGGMVGCQPEADAGEGGDKPGEESGEAETPPVVEVTALDYAFQVPDSMPSGWVTLRMPNEGEATHYTEIDRLTEGNTFEAYRPKRIELIARTDRLTDLLPEIDDEVDFCLLATLIYQITLASER